LNYEPQWQLYLDWIITTKQSKQEQPYTHMLLK